MPRDDAPRYRKVSPRIWGDEKFVSLGEGEKLLALYILTSDQTNRIGCFRFSPGKAAEDLGCSANTLGNRFETVCQTLGWKFSEKVKILLLPTWFEYNPPHNPNQVQGWSSDFSDLPDDPLKWQCFQELRTVCERLGEPFLKRFLQAFPEPSRNGWGNQEQEQEQKQDTPPIVPPVGGEETVSRKEIDWRIDQTWEAHLKQRTGFFRKETGGTPPEPTFTAAIRQLIRDSLLRHDSELLEPEERERWAQESLTRAAGIGIFLDAFMTGRHRDNEVKNGGRRYLEPERPWKIPRGKPDPVPRFAERYFEARGGAR